MAAEGRSSLRPPVFIVGCRRSGTTLLSRVVGSHPAVAMYHESFLFPIFRGELRWYGRLDRPARMRELVRDVRRVVTTQLANPPTVDDILEAVPAPSLAGVLAALLHLHARSEGKPRGGDKTPDHHAHLDVIVPSFPESPVLFVVRDPRDVVRSIRQLFGGSVEGAAWAWRRAFEDLERHRSRVHVVRYEALARHPRDTARGVCEIIGEGFRPEMLDFHHDTPSRFDRPGGEKLSQPIDDDSIGRFRDMRSSEIALVERVCVAGMEALGYEPASAPRGRAAPVPRRGSRVCFLIDRVRYYGLRPERWRRGWARWKVTLSARWRFVVRWVLRMASR